ncbi:MAG: AAA family ATPase, partial [Bacteroidia bacterium]
MGIYSIKIQNFKSIRNTDEIKLNNMNVLIGPNGAGKSNFISFFKFLNKLYDQQLQLFISQNGRAENFLYFGRKKSDFLSGKITFTNEWRNEYEFKMVPDQAGNLLFAEEWSNYTKPSESDRTKDLTSVPNRVKINTSGNLESVLNNDGGWRTNYLKKYFSSLKLFHFHDTSFNSKVKQPCGTTDYAYLYEDGGNL